MLKTIAIIPARMAATRFAGKPMAPMLGMPMVGHCYHRARLAQGIDAVYVATCDEEIANYIIEIGGNAVMTSDHHKRATTRTAEALEIIEEETGLHYDIVVMVQGDEPLINPEVIGATLVPFEDESVEIVNIMSRLDTLEAFSDKNNVKVVVNQNNDAMYFSREAIPSPWHGIDGVPCYNQTGIIAFRNSALSKFNAMDESRLEIIESVDMNRVLEAGGKIRMVLSESISFGVDTKNELEQAEAILRDDPVCMIYIINK